MARLFSQSLQLQRGGGGRNVSDPRLMSQAGRVLAYQCVSAIRAVDVSVFAFLRSRCNHVTEFVNLALDVVVQNKADFIDGILLYFPTF